MNNSHRNERTNENKIVFRTPVSRYRTAVHEGIVTAVGQ